MRQRIITGVLGAVVFLSLLAMGSWWYSTVLFLLAAIAFLEYAEMKRLSWKKPQVLAGVVMIALIFAAGLSRQHAVPFWLDEALLVPGALTVFSVWIVASRNRFDLEQMAYLFVGMLYIGYGFSAMMQTIWKANGLALSLLVIFITWANDSGAYFIGRKWGKTKLIPEISPNKTLEGSFAGVVFGMVVSIVVFLMFPPLGDLGKAVWLGLLIAVVGQVGDLVESAFKRTVGVKDSGSILPGHGGVLDRFDSLVFSFLVLSLLKFL
jgi:phosphatidate cytidylyltransferase